MTLRFLITIFLVVIGTVNGGLEDHFKIPQNKDGPFQMKNIDFIYMINLDERPEKFAESLNEFMPYGITPYRFSAVNGWNLSEQALNEVGVKFESWMKHGMIGTCYRTENGCKPTYEPIQILGRNYFSYPMSLGAIGINLSHLSILNDAYKSGYETIWVMEDDIKVIKNPHLISELIEKLDLLVGKDGWDFLFTDSDTKDKQGSYVLCFSAAERPNFTSCNPAKFSQRFDVGEDFRKVGARYGAYSMIVRRSGMKKMLEFMQNGIFLPYDMEYTLPDQISLYTVRDDIVSTVPAALSDNEMPTYLNLNLQ